MIGGLPASLALSGSNGRISEVVSGPTDSYIVPITNSDQYTSTSAIAFISVQNVYQPLSTAISTLSEWALMLLAGSLVKATTWRQDKA